MTVEVATLVNTVDLNGDLELVEFVSGEEEGRVGEFVSVGVLGISTTGDLKTREGEHEDGGLLGHCDLEAGS